MTNQEKLVNELKEKIKEQNRLLLGSCPECGNRIKGWKPMFGSFAPEWWATCREQGVDPATGHSLKCSNKSLKL